VILAEFTPVPNAPSDVDPEPKSAAASPPEPLLQAEAMARTAEQAARREIGGPQGPEPTRYGDWERNGRCIDF
jgi:hypothetical protein